MTPNLFRELARQGPQQAPASLERVLLREFRLRKWRRRAAAIAIAALAAVLLLSVFIRRPQPVPPPQPRLAQIAVPEWDRPPVLSSPARIRRPKQPRREVATRFYPLQDAANLPPFEYGSVLRVELPRSALRAVGLPVNENRLSERIDADVLLGQDGLARAVRFVQ